jgi:uncharacterized coiled-coil protein SlyX
MSNGSLETRVTQLEAQMQDIRDLVQQTARNVAELQASQARTEQNLNRLDQKFESFLARWSQINADLGDRIEQTRAIADRNAAAVTNLLRNSEADRLENRINRDRVNLLIERVEELLGRQ